MVLFLNKEQREEANPSHHTAKCGFSLWKVGEDISCDRLSNCEEEEGEYLVPGSCG